jgi:hypothetical protein
MRQFFRYMRTGALISLLCLFLGWSLPAQAATSVNPKLEQQILQVLRQHPEVIIESVQTTAKANTPSIFTGIKN